MKSIQGIDGSSWLGRRFGRFKCAPRVVRTMPSASCSTLTFEPYSSGVVYLILLFIPPPIILLAQLSEAVVPLFLAL